MPEPCCASVNYESACKKLASKGGPRHQPDCRSANISAIVPGFPFGTSLPLWVDVTRSALSGGGNVWLPNSFAQYIDLGPPLLRKASCASSLASCASSLALSAEMFSSNSWEMDRRRCMTQPRIFVFFAILICRRPAVCSEPGIFRNSFALPLRRTRRPDRNPWKPW